jgi:hypothetical protein
MALAQGTLYVSNLGQTSGGSAAIASDSWIAEPFYTGSNSDGYILNSISLLMSAASGSPSGFNVSIYSVSTSEYYPPGSFIGSLSGNSNPSTSGIYSYTTSGITLLPDTHYFVVVNAATPQTVGTYQWNYHSLDDIPVSGIDGWGLSLLYDTSTDGLTWNYARISLPQLAVYATPVPEPSTLALGALGALFLGFRRWRNVSR